MAHKILVAVCESQTILFEADALLLVQTLKDDERFLNAETDYVRFISYSVECTPQYTILD